MRRFVIAVVFLLALLVTSSSSAAIMRWGGYTAYGYGMTQNPTEETLPPEAGQIIKIDAGNATSYLLSNNGTLWAFGKNNAGSLGNGTTESSLSPGQVVFPAGTKIQAVGEGHATGFAVDSSGQGWSWGNEHNEQGEGPAQALCLGHQSGDVLTPRKVPGLTKASAVQGGATHVIWLMQNGTVETCGANYEGQLGIGSSEPGASYAPVTVPGLSNVAEVSAGQATTCARTATGDVYVWGGDKHGQVGNGVEQEAGVFSPYHVPLPGPASEISCGGNFGVNGSTLAIVGGLVYGWGDDEQGQLGDGQKTNKPSPVLASETTLLHLTQVITSGTYSLGVNAAGEVYGWGADTEFTIAAPNRLKSYLAPRLINTGAVEVSGTAFDSLER